MCSVSDGCGGDLGDKGDRWWCSADGQTPRLCALAEAPAELLSLWAYCWDGVVLRPAARPCASHGGARKAWWLWERGNTFLGVFLPLCL